jgi:uncharacterized protein (TIGR00297 family)
MFDASIHLSLLNLAVGLSLAALVAAGAWYAGMLSSDGWVAATLVGGLTYGLGGLPAAILLITFFVSSSLLSRAFARRKRQVAANFAKGGRRDWAQVAANGAPAVLALVMSTTGLLSEPAAWVIFAAALATVTADTWATEVGVLSTKMPILITTGKPVSPGSSGGISWLGSTVALMGALLIGILAWFLGITSLTTVPLIALAGLLGSFVDSALGATVQAIYYCPKCEKQTERHPLHYCGTPTTLHHGWPWLNNDWVNFLSSVFSALLAAAIFVVR